MTPIEFEQRFMKITAQFSSRGYNVERVSLIFEEVKNIDASDFEKVVTHFIGNSRTAPLVADFRKAIQDLGIRKNGPTIAYNQSAHVTVDPDYDYCIRDNIWADKTKVYCRGNSIRECFVVYKNEYPDHPLVIEDSQVRAERLKEVKNYLIKNQYSEYVRLKTGTVPHGTLKLVNPMEGI